MAVTFYCPSCNSALVVREDAPTHLNCPVCVAPLVNPLARAPMPVLPIAAVDREVRGDALTVRWVLSGIVLLLGAAAVLTAMTIGAGNAIFHMLIMLLVVVFIGIGIREGTERDAMTLRAEAEAEAQARGAEAIGAAASEEAARRAAAGGGTTLDYRSPYAYQRRREPMGAGALATGLFASLGVCATGFFILAGTVDVAKERHGEILLGVVLMVLGFMFGAPYLAGRRGSRGFGLGATIGMALGLCALGPCAFCYTMTIR